MIAKQIINHRHRHFSHFAMRLLAAEECQHNLDHTIEALNTIPQADISGTLEWFKNHGAICDCEVVDNIIIRMFDHPIIP